MDSREKDFADISQSIMNTYHDEIHAYLSSKPAGVLTDSDVIIIIMNLTIGTATNIYYSLKQILPSTPMDFDFMKAKICNSLIDSFEKIKNYSPKETYMPLTIEQLVEIKEKGFAIIKMADGSDRKVTQNEILMKKKDVDKLVENSKKEKSDAANSPKIIGAGNGLFPGQH